MANEKEKKRKRKPNSMKKKIMRLFFLEAKILNYLKSKK